MSRIGVHVDLSSVIRVNLSAVIHLSTVIPAKAGIQGRSYRSRNGFGMAELGMSNIPMLFATSDTSMDARVTSRAAVRKALRGDDARKMALKSLGPRLRGDDGDQAIAFHHKRYLNRFHHPLRSPPP
jgi:hypothetical protein